MEPLPTFRAPRLVRTPSWQETVDDAWTNFVARLPVGLRDEAHALSVTLLLTPTSRPWSAVFAEEITLALPFAVAQGVPGATPVMVRNAVMAHLLCVLGELASERLRGREVAATPRLVQLLERMGTARDAVLAPIAAPTSSPLFDFRAAALAAARARTIEQEFLALGVGADLEMHARLSANKHLLLLPATMTLARAGGLGEAALRGVEGLCRSLAMGLQLRSDAARWQEHHAQGRAWATRLLRHAEGPGSSADDPGSLSRRLAESGTLGAMRDAAIRHFEAAAQQAKALGAQRLVAWAERQIAHTRALGDDERRAPARHRAA